MTWTFNADPSLCPPVIVESLARYVGRGIPTGDFLRAVLENDLREAIGRGDYINGPAIAHIVACGSTKAELIGFTNPNRYGHGKYCVNTAQCNRRKRDRAMAEAIMERHDFDWTATEKS